MIAASNRDDTKAELYGKVALVTGAAGAIGSAVVKLLLSSGAKVLMIDNDSAALRRIETETGCVGEGMIADLNDTTAIARTADQVLERYGAVDILINNAGILTNNKLATTDLAEWQRVMAVNVDAPFLLIQKFVPGMVNRRWGRIVNMSSFAWKSGGKTAGTSYATSKAALVGLTFSVARETAEHGVTVNGIAPAYVLSPMITAHLSPEVWQRTLDDIPVKRFCTPEEVAHTVGFLVSPKSGFITGEIIDMNGGLQFN